MEDSIIISSKDTKDKKKISKHQEKTPELRKSKSGWKSFFNIFLNANTEKKKDLNGVYLDEIDDEFAMAISMPKDVEGKDVEVTIELKAISKCLSEKSNGSSALEMTEVTPSKSTFSGNVKIPYDTTIEEISKMPLYFINPVQIKRGDGKFTNKIETVVRPLQDNMPSNIEKNMLVRNLNLKVQLQNTKKLKKVHDKSKSLSYTFLVREKVQSKLCDIKLDDIVEDATSADDRDYNETSKNIVKEILNQVVNKVQGSNDISTQYSNIITSVSKEIDIQKSLLMNKPDDNKISFPKISRHKKLLTSEETLYPRTSTTNTNIDTSSIYTTESGSSMYYLKAPTNTPNVQNPRYVIKYDNRLLPPERKHGEVYLKVMPKFADEPKLYVKSIYEKKRRDKTRLIDENLRADIDKTLDLLESAKHRLLSYINPSEYEGDKRKKYTKHNKHGEMWLESPTFDRMGQYSPPISKRGIRKEKNIEKKLEKNEEQFFRAKNEEIPDLITFFDMEQPITINTLQNIYDPEIVIKKSSTLITNEKEMLLKIRYSGDGQHKIAYDIVESDINIMIKDLLEASNDIKESVIEAINIKNETTKKLAQDAIINDVKAVMDLLLERTEQEIANKPIFDDFDPPNNAEPLCINYCIIDEIINEDHTKALLEELPKSTTVSVKRIPSTRLDVISIIDHNLTNILEKDTHFIAEICQEVCTVNCKDIFNLSKNNDDNNNNPQPQPPPQIESSKEFIPTTTNVLQTNKEENLTPIGSNYLKHAAKINPEVTTIIPSSDPLTNSSEEVILETLDLQPKVDAKESTITKRSRATYVPTSSSDDVSQVTVRKRIPKPNPPSTVKTPKIESSNSSISSRSLYTVHDSDYDADKDEMVLPNFKQEYVSVQELNNQQEIDDIDENVQKNEILNVDLPDDDVKKKSSIFKLIESTESITTSVSLESESNTDVVK